MGISAKRRHKLLDGARRSVANGIVYLDRTSPGWENKIDLGTLDISDGDCCALAQVDNTEFVNATANRKISDHDARRYGTLVQFGLSIEENALAYRFRTSLFSKAVRNRRLAAERENLKLAA